MKKLLLFASVAFVSIGFAQTTIYQENFETGNSFTMNSTDLGGATTYNTWLMNNTYTGGSGTFVCLGFPFSFTVVNTPSQPGGITNSPSSNYMHIAAQAAVSSGINCASYIPSDGTCVSNESNFAKMTSSISTVGFTNVTFDFWWMCAGSATAFGELYYSLDGGTTWTLKQSNLNNVTNWSQTAITDPAWSNQASLKFAFRFVNTTATTAADPAFSVDEIIVTGTGAATNSITTDGLTLTGWCFGSTVTQQVLFTATGTYNPGNTYTVELSDASGSFAAPLVIGSLVSSANGSLMIPAVVPGTVPVGSGYRIRVTASNPSTIGTDNGTDLSVYSVPSVTFSALSDVCVNAPWFPLTGGSPAGGNYSGTGVSSGSFDPAVAGVGTSNITYVYADGNGCANSASQPINVLNAPTAQFNLPISELCVYASPYTLTGGTTAGGTYSGPGVTGGVFDPAVAGLGVWTLTYELTDANGCSDQAYAIIQVTPCAGIDENAYFNYSISPNPAESSFILLSEVDFDALQLLDLNGRVVMSFQANEQVDVSGIRSGMYLIRMESNGNSGIERLMIK